MRVAAERWRWLMRKVLCALALVGILGMAALGAQWFSETRSFVDIASTPYQRFASSSEVAIIMNDTGGAATGLRITYSSPVTPVVANGIASSVAVVSNVDAVVVLSGDIPVNGTVSVEWPLGSAEILAAEWLNGDAVAGAVDLHAPIAVISGQSDVALTFFDMPAVVAQVSATGDLSRSPDGSPIVRYLWEWSDGVSQEGSDVSRTFVIELGDDRWDFRQSESLTLTVWNAAGGSSSVTHPVLIVVVARPPA
jgi:hypothetical protein